MHLKIGFPIDDLRIEGWSGDRDYFVADQLQAQGVFDAIPKGSGCLLGRAPTDDNAKLLREDRMKVLQPAIDRAPSRSSVRRGAGKVGVSGQDADLSAIRRIVARTQTGDV